METKVGCTLSRDEEEDGEGVLLSLLGGGKSSRMSDQQKPENQTGISW
jgi:hypothetical protein